MRKAAVLVANRTQEGREGRIKAQDGFFKDTPQQDLLQPGSCPSNPFRYELINEMIHNKVSVLRI